MTIQCLPAPLTDGCLQFLVHAPEDLALAFLWPITFYAVGVGVLQGILAFALHHGERRAVLVGGE